MWNTKDKGFNERLLVVLNKGNVTGKKEKNMPEMIWENAWIILSLQMTHWCLTKSDDGSTLYRNFRNVYCSLCISVCGWTALTCQAVVISFTSIFSSFSSLKVETMFDTAYSPSVQYRRFDIIVQWNKQLYHLGPPVSKVQSVISEWIGQNRKKSIHQVEKKNPE